MNTLIRSRSLGLEGGEYRWSRPPRSAGLPSWCRRSGGFESRLPQDRADRVAGLRPLVSLGVAFGEAKHGPCLVGAIQSRVRPAAPGRRPGRVSRPATRTRRLARGGARSGPSARGRRPAAIDERLAASARQWAVIRTAWQNPWRRFFSRVRRAHRRALCQERSRDGRGSITARVVGGKSEGGARPHRGAARAAGREPTRSRWSRSARPSRRPRVAPALAAGQRIFGENRVQEAKAKFP